MDATGLAAVPTLDMELDRQTGFEQCRAPFARAGSDQQLASQFGR